MEPSVSRQFVSRIFRERLRATVKPSYLTWQSINAPDGRPLAVLGFRSAGHGPLFLESYLDAPIEDVLAERFGIAVDRDDVVEIGCLAAMPSPALVRLWHESASRLSAQHSIAVATLTEPLRSAFNRVGLPFDEIAPARRGQAPRNGERWGGYYGLNPVVCAGRIGPGLAALSHYAGRLGKTA
jgi:hypothetical protein